MRNHPESAEADQGYIARLEALIGQDAAAEDYYEALEEICGGSPTSTTFKGTMLILRKNQREDLVWDLSQALETSAKEVADPNDRKLYEDMILAVLELLEDVELVSKPNTTPQAEIRNTLRKSGDDYRNQTRNSMERAA